MESQETSKFGVPWQWLILGLSLVGFLVLKKPLSTSRPERSGNVNLPSVGLQDVDARLWQDPFSAVKDHLRISEDSDHENPSGTGEDRHHSVEHFFAQVRSEVSASNPKVCVMPIFLRSSPFSEDAEVRLRTRLAVTMGLATAQYDPIDPDHIGFVRIPWVPTNAPHCHRDDRRTVWITPITSETTAESIVVPIERFRTNGFGDGVFHEVIVLWLRTVDFTPDPLPRLARLYDYVTNHLHGASVSLRIIGPADSDGLMHMLSPPAVASDNGIGEKRAKDILGTGMLFSPSATVSSFALHMGRPNFEDAQVSEMTDSWMKESFGLSFISATPTDDEILKLLVAEFKLRGVDPWRDPIAIVYERDTLYGRGLRHTFSRISYAVDQFTAPDGGDSRDAAAARVIALTQNELQRAFTATTGINDSKMQIFTYSRGLDGELAYEEREQSSRDPFNPRTEVRADGGAYSDYLARLTDRMKDIEIQMGTPFKGICIFGTDVYDKLLILRAMRPEFSKTLFATTDLDARYLQANYYEETRNLLVASAMGNLVEGRNQTPNQRFTPFRDSNQALVARSVLLALAPNEAERKKLETGYSALPRMYEIGRSRAVRLDLPASARQNAYGMSTTWRYFQVASIVIALALLVSWLLRPWGRSSEAPGQTECKHALRAIVLGFIEDSPFRLVRFWKVTWICLAVICLGSIGVWMLAGESREPRSTGVFVEGISIWPTEFGLLLTSVFCVWALFYIHFALASRIESIRLAFFSEAPVENGAEAHRAMSTTQGPANAGGESDSKVSAEVVWMRFLKRTKSAATFKSAAWLLGASLMVAFGLSAFGEERLTPARGDLAFEVDWFNRRIAVASLLMLLVIVVIRVRQVWSVCDEIGISTTAWPPQLEREVKRVFKIPTWISHGWCDIHFLGALTSVVGSFIYLPFIGISLFAVSHWAWFDNWAWGGGVLVMTVGGAVVVALCALALRHAAEVVRAVNVRKIEVERLKVAAGDVSPEEKGAPTDSGHAEGPATLQSLESLFERMLTEFRDFKVGAFAPLFQQPIIGAVLIPLGGSGSLALLERLLR